VPHIKRAEAPTFTTPNAVMTGLAGPSRGSAELSMWQVELEPAAAGPVHLIDREQVYLVTEGTMAIMTDGTECQPEAGDTVIIPAGAMRQIRNQGESVTRAVVCMAAGGRAAMPAGEDRGLLPWAT
jgi:quercetin dioxygenase-like cupin family protein